MNRIHFKDKTFQSLLRDAFEAPKPMRKRTFLRSCPMRRISFLSFVLSQTGYIRKSVLALNCLVLLAALLAAVSLNHVSLGAISALTPILAVTLITESGRSQRWEMAELEMSTRLSLKSVVLARMALLGGFDLLLLLIMTPLAAQEQHISLIRTGVYLLCPYLVTTNLCLWICRKIRGRGSTYICGGATALVILGMMVFRDAQGWYFYEEQYFIYWLLLLITAVFGTVSEGIKTVKRTEELEWNLSSTD